MLNVFHHNSVFCVIINKKIITIKNKKIMKKINLIHGFIAAFVSVILIALCVVLFEAKSTSEWSCHKADSVRFTEADSVRFEVGEDDYDFDKTYKLPVEEKFAAVDTLVVYGGGYFLIKNDRLFAGYSEKNLVERRCNIAELMKPFERVESHVTNGELWIRK